MSWDDPLEGEDPDGLHPLYVWIEEGMTDWDLYTGFRKSGAPCIGAHVVRQPSGDEPGIGVVSFR